MNKQYVKSVLWLNFTFWIQRTYIHFKMQNATLTYFNKSCYKGQSKITEPYLITFKLSKMDIYLDDISLKLYVIYLIT